MKRIALAAVLAVAPSALAWQVEKLQTSGGLTLEYVLVLPEEFDAGRSWPVLLALPGGRQDSPAALNALHSHYGSDAAARGWVTVVPIAPRDVRFHEGAEALIPELLDEIAARVPVEGGRFHLAGSGSGGLSAFRVAIQSPERFASLVAFPGGPASASDVSRLDRLSGLQVRLFAGTEDAEFLRLMRGTAKQLARLGIDVQAATLQGEGVPPSSIDAAVLFEVLEQARQLQARPGLDGEATSHATPDELLDDLQAAAARGNGRRFFDCFSDEAIVYWLDPDARWTLPELRQRLQPRFGSGELMRFGSDERHLQPLPGTEAVAFDEKLSSLELGRCRAQGLLVREGPGWRILRYGLHCAAQPVLPTRRP